MAYFNSGTATAAPDFAVLVESDTLMAPFAAFPVGGAPCGAFNIAGRCWKCDEFGWLAHFIVWPSPREWPPIRYSDGAYCRDCMLLMGVGADGRE